VVIPHHPPGIGCSGSALSSGRRRGCGVGAGTQLKAGPQVTDSQPLHSPAPSLPPSEGGCRPAEEAHGHFREGAGRGQNQRGRCVLVTSGMTVELGTLLRTAARELCCWWSPCSVPAAPCGTAQEPLALRELLRAVLQLRFLFNGEQGRE